MSPDFPAFALTEEHEALRAAVRQLADEKIAPHAAKVDQTPEFPADAHDALVKNDLHAVHIPEQYGGAGADAIATVIVIEEVARACASSSLIPAVNKLGTVPLLLSASEELKQRYLPRVASGEGMFSYALSEADAGSDAASMTTRAVRDGDSYVLNGAKRWITNAGVSKFYTVMAVTEPGAGAGGISAFVVEDGDQGFSFGALEHKLGIKGSPTRELYFDNCAIPADRMIGAAGSGFRTALATLDHTRITIAAQALGIAQGALDYASGYVKERRQFGQAIAEFQGDPVHAGRHGHEGRGRPAAHLRGRGPVRPGHGRRAGARPDVHVLGLQVLRLRRRHGRHHRCCSAAGRLRVCQRLPGGADDA